MNSLTRRTILTKHLKIFVAVHYDGDGKTDIAVFEKEVGIYFKARGFSGFQYISVKFTKIKQQPREISSYNSYYKKYNSIVVNLYWIY